MWHILRRPIATLMLATSTLAGMILLALPIRSQQNGRLPAAISQAQAPSNSLPQQNSSPSASVGQVSPSAATEEAAGVTVVLDPAHRGADFGARGPTGLAESDVVLDFARAARIALEAQRLRVLLTREGNQDPTFDNRSAMVNGLRNAVFVSLHVSSSGPVGTARAYYYVFPSDLTPVASPAALAANAPGQTFPPPASAPQITARANLIEWDHAQRSSVDLSRQIGRASCR